MCHLGRKAKYLLDMIINRNRKAEKIWLSQNTYILKILLQYGMNDCKPVSTPFDPSTKLNNETEPRNLEEINKMNKIPYREAVGSLLYAI